MGQHPETGQDISRKSGRFGPYVETGEGKEAKRASIPKDNSAAAMTTSAARGAVRDVTQLKRD
jgi:DNA topoisomerase-1